MAAARWLAALPALSVLGQGQMARTAAPAPPSPPPPGPPVRKRPRHSPGSFVIGQVDGADDDDETVEWVGDCAPEEECREECGPEEAAIGYLWPMVALPPRPTFSLTIPLRPLAVPRPIAPPHHEETALMGPAPRPLALTYLWPGDGEGDNDDDEIAPGEEEEEGGGEEEEEEQLKREEEKEVKTEEEETKLDWAEEMEASNATTLACPPIVLGEAEREEPASGATTPAGEVEEETGEEVETGDEAMDEM